MANSAAAWLEALVDSDSDFILVDVGDDQAISCVCSARLVINAAIKANIRIKREREQDGAGVNFLSIGEYCPDNSVEKLKINQRNQRRKRKLKFLLYLTREDDPADRPRPSV